jgi:hypothetical protein
MFSACSHGVPQVVPQDIPNSTLILSYMVCPKFNSHIYKLKRQAKEKIMYIYKNKDGNPSTKSTRHVEANVNTRKENQDQ